MSSAVATPKHQCLRRTELARSLRQQTPQCTMPTKTRTESGTATRQAGISLLPPLCKCVASHTFPNNTSTMPQSALRQCQKKQRSLPPPQTQGRRHLTIRISKHTTKQTTRELKNEVQNQTRFPPPDAASQLMTSRSNPSVHQLLTQFQTEMVAPPQTRISFWNKKCTPGRNIMRHTPRAEIPRSFPSLDHNCCLHSKPSEDQTQHTRDRKLHRPVRNKRRCLQEED